MKPRVYIVGAGITGCSLAHFLKEDFEVVLYEKSFEIGGLLKTKSNLEGLKYQSGNQILHTNEEWIISFLKKYIPLREVDFLVSIDPLFDLRYYDFPFTKKAIDYLPWHWNEAISLDLESVRGHTASNVAKLIQNFYGQTAYDIFYKDLLRKFLLKDPYHIKDVKWAKKKFLRRIADEEKYFNEQYVYFPVDVGYNDLFHEFTEGVNVEVNTTITYSDIPRDGQIILTTRPDDFFGGNTDLEYIKTEFDIDSAVHTKNKPDLVFYPNYTPFICINQFGRFFQGEKNIVSKIYHSLNDGFDTYPVHTSKNIETYKKLYESFSNEVLFVGPKASYQFMDVADCISAASNVAAKLKHKRTK